MGIVYKAEDTTLERTVALKFLAQHLLNDEEAKERFLREAKAAAALSHPNICTVYEIAEVDGKTFIAMEFVKGETLEERIAAGPLTLKDALDIGRQVADGLEAAHEENIIHRDIKPANVMVDAKGHAKVMDFGLARLTEASRLTKTNTAMGTVAYMSPEHAQGIEVDTRTDIWALGCVLYEMIFGQRPFQGQYDQALLYEIVHQEPAALTGLRTGVPVELEFIVNECLAKDRDDRTGTAQEVSRKLRTLAEKLKSGHSTILRTTNLTGAVPATMTGAQTVESAEALPPDAVVMKRSSQRALQGLAAAVILALLGVTYAYLTVPEPDKPVRRFSFAPDDYIARTSVISPDGKSILYRTGSGAQASLWLRSLSEESVREIPGTEGAYRAFGSPDSRSIGFGIGTPDFELRRISIDGGDAITLTELPSQTDALVGGTWSPDGERIVFSSGRRLYEIPARGGEPELLFDPGDAPRSTSIYPHFLPTDNGSQGLVYTAWGSPTDRALAVMDLKTGERRDLGLGGEPFYSSDGYLIHGPTDQNEPGLRALPFSLDTLEATGQSFPIDETGRTVSVSRDGTLVYTDGAAGGPRQIVVRDRSGTIVQPVGDPVAISYAQGTPAVSPDGRYIAITVEGDVWVYDLERDVRTRLTASDAIERVPVWISSGSEVAYITSGQISVMARVADASTAPRVVVETDRIPSTWGASTDSRYLAYGASAGSTEGEGGLSYHERGADGAYSQRIDILLTPGHENGPEFSPNNRYLAYNSNETGRFEIYVRPFPDGPGKWRVSTNGGRQPRWSADGSELFYVEDGTNMLTAVPVSTGPTFTVGAPQALFASEGLQRLGNNNWWKYDVFPDSQRFVTLAPAGGDDGDSLTTIRVVENWYEEFRDQAQ